MANILTLTGPGLNAGDERRDCRCVLNTRTGRGTKICKVPKSKKHRSGTVIAGRCDNPIRTK